MRSTGKAVGLLLAIALLASMSSAQWTTLTNAPGFSNGASTPLLLLDGRVTVTGTMTDEVSGVDPTTARYWVVDEYEQVQPAGSITLQPNGSYVFTVSLQSSRRGQDRDGRTYTVYITCKDLACNETTISFVVTVPHDRRR